MMPGHVSSPKLQRLSTKWAAEFGFNSGATMHTLAEGVVKYAGYTGLGEVATSPAVKGGLPALVKPIISLIDKIHNPAIKRAQGKWLAGKAGLNLPEEEIAA